MFNQNDLVFNLAEWLAGDFSNQAQAFAEPRLYAHIRVFFRPLPWEFFGGIGFYSEQMYDYDLWQPYRQAVHHLVLQEQQIYVENYSLKEPLLYTGAGRDRDILLSITPDHIDRRDHCAFIFQKEGDLFRGQIEGKNCLIARGGKLTYLVSEAIVTEDSLIMCDRGLDVETNMQIWGSSFGPLKFSKRQSFAHEIPIH